MVLITRATDPNEPEKGGLVADRRLWLDAGRTRVVEDGDPAAAFQLVAPGRPIPRVDVVRLGLTLVDGALRQGAGKQAAPTANKMAAPAENKSAKAPKGRAAPKTTRPRGK